jgi:hypothetical protein
MEIAHRWLDRNLSKLELIVAMIILLLLVGSFSRYMFSVFGKVEKSMIDRTLININTAINYEAAFAVMRKDTESINKLLLMNPMNIMTNELNINEISKSEALLAINHLPTLPTNYAGIVIDDSDTSLQSGNWYFDQDDRVLFYILNNAEFFKSNLEGSARIRYKIKLNYIDRDNDSSFSPLIDKFESMQLQSLDHYEWLF